MTRRAQIQQSELELLESEFESLLPVMLKKCAAGYWGLFEDRSHYHWSLHWADAVRLRELAAGIHDLRSEFGEANPRVERFLTDCAQRGPNRPGEPKLAQAFLADLESGLLSVRAE